jgi:translation elongation factor EF-1alpha
LADQTSNRVLLCRGAKRLFTLAEKVLIEDGEQPASTIKRCESKGKSAHKKTSPYSNLMDVSEKREEVRRTATRKNDEVLTFRIAAISLYV